MSDPVVAAENIVLINDIEHAIAETERKIRFETEAFTRYQAEYWYRLNKLIALKQWLVKKMEEVNEQRPRF